MRREQEKAQGNCQSTYNDETINLLIPGNPLAKKRPRFARRGKFVTTYSDQETEEGKFYMQAMDQLREKIQKPIEGPLILTCVYSFKRPQNHQGTGKNKNTLKPTAPGTYNHTVKPDCDNLQKFTMDCLNGLLFVDDKQITTVVAIKKWSDVGVDGYTAVNAVPLINQRGRYFSHIIIDFQNNTFRFHREIIFNADDEID